MFTRSHISMSAAAPWLFIASLALAAAPLAAQRGGPLKPNPRIGREPPPAKGDTQPTPPTYPRPTNFTAQVYRGAGTVDFRWSRPPGATSVALLKASDPNGSFTAPSVMDTSGDWARDRSAAVGQTTYYKLVAMFPLPTGGNAASMSDVLKVTVPTGPVGPTQLQGASLEEGKVVLTWVGDPEAVGYSVWRLFGANREMMAEVGNKTTFTDLGGHRGITYRYAVFGTYADPNTSTEVFVDVTVR